RAASEHLTDGALEPLEMERFSQQRELELPAGRVEVRGRRGEHDDADRGVPAPEIPDQVETGSALHQEVRDDEIVVPLLEEGEGGVTARRLDRLTAPERQHIAQETADPLFVVHDQDPGPSLVTHWGSSRKRFREGTGRIPRRSIVDIAAGNAAPRISGTRATAFHTLSHRKRCAGARVQPTGWRTRARAGVRWVDFQIVDICGYVDKCAWFERQLCRRNRSLGRRVRVTIVRAPAALAQSCSGEASEGPGGPIRLSQSRSMTVAIPWPKPMHIVWSP